jgi:sulfatase modifying factor 1
VKPGRSIRGAFALATAIGALAFGCSVALDFNGIDDGAPDATPGGADGAIQGKDGSPPPPPADATGGGADATPILDAGSDTTLASDASDAQTVTDAPVLNDGPCGNRPGPTMVSVDTFCVDSTEVTIGQYTAFLAAKAGDVSGQPPICSWNGSFVPSGGVSATATNLPIANVNWCQAYSYCAWAGKHLCGAPDGGVGDRNRWGDAVDSAWFHACSHNNDGLHTYPYGLAYEATVCNGADYSADAQALPSLASCEGGYPGLFDMSGNVWEWEDRCWPTSDDAGLTGPGDFCFTRGGAFSEGSGSLTCGVGVGYTRGSQGGNIGFRCCSP